MEVLIKIKVKRIKLINLIKRKKKVLILIIRVSFYSINIIIYLISSCTHS